MHTLGGRRRDATHSHQVFRTASRGTPEAVIEALNKAVRDALANPKLKLRFGDLGQEIPPAEQQTALAQRFPEGRHRQVGAADEGGEGQDRLAARLGSSHRHSRAIKAISVAMTSMVVR